MSHRSRFGLRNRPLKETPLSSYRRTLVYQWLDAAKITQDRVGGVLTLMRDRRDMPRSFPTKGHMYRYIRKCGVSDEVVEHVFERVWALYRLWLETARTSVTAPGAVVLPRPRKTSDNPWDDYAD